MAFVFNQSQQYLFNRAYAVTLGQPINPFTAGIGPLATLSNFAPGKNALQYGTLSTPPCPMRVRFDIDRTAVGSSNKSKIEIYNLSQQSRQNVKKGYLIKVDAGYNGLVRTIFVGNVVNPISARHGADIITTLEAGDGESSLVFATLDKAYPAGTQMYQILQDVITAMGLDAGPILGIPNVIFQKGFVASGTCSDTLNKLLNGRNVDWHVQNGQLTIIPSNSTNGQSATLISSQTGMIGVPSTNNGYTTFTALLNPNIAPGSLVQLISENTSLNGYYKVTRAHYEGDSHEAKWQVACECIPISATQSTPAATGKNLSTAVSS